MSRKDDRLVRAATTAALLVAALTSVGLAGCGGTGGPRRMRLTGTGADSGGDGGTDSAPPLPPFMCSGSISLLNCAAPFMLPADGHVTDFSSREWSNPSGKWCDEGGMHGSIFSFPGSGAMDSNSHGVTDGSFRLSLTVSAGSYGGGGLAFEAGCVDASAFTGVQFSIAVASGSLTGCTYQLQLQTFEQRPIMQNAPNPPGGCDQNTASCYNFPAARNLAAPSTDPANPTLVTVPFSAFTAAVTPAPAQLVGLQWQVNSSTGACTVELRVDNIGFIPAAQPPDAGGGDDASGATDAATD